MGDVNNDQQRSFGQMLRNARTCLQLTQQEIAERFSVTVKEVDLFECDQPMRLDAKLRILKQLYAAKARKQLLPVK